MLILPSALGMVFLYPNHPGIWEPVKGLIILCTLSKAWLGIVNLSYSVERKIRMPCEDKMLSFNEFPFQQLGNE